MVQALQKAFRSANKERKVRMFTESANQSKTSVTEGAKVRRPMHPMEDEDEVIEHKSIGGGRRDSKKTIPALIVSIGLIPTLTVSTGLIEHAPV